MPAKFRVIFHTTHQFASYFNLQYTTTFYSTDNIRKQSEKLELQVRKEARTCCQIKSINIFDQYYITIVDWTAELAGFPIYIF